MPKPKQPTDESRAALTVETLPLASLKPHPRNPRKHPDPGSPEWAVMCASLKADYFDPIVWNKRNGLLVSGHLRTKALLSIGKTHADCVVVDYDESTHIARMIAANKSIGQDETAMLKDLLEELDTGAVDMATTGYAEEELAKLMDQIHVDGDEQDAEPQIDRAEELNKEWCVKPGDLWLIGDHRLLCGDSTKADDVARLLGDRKPVLMVTDPPYGVEYDPSWRADAGVNKNKGKMGKVANDDVADWSSAWALFPGDVAYVWHAPGPLQAVVLTSLECCGFNARSHIIWAKDRLVLSRGDYHWQHEPCWYAVRDGRPGHRTDDRKQTTLWEIPARDDAGHGHGTQKPVECMARPMRNHHAPEVYDPFLGSGTTMVAGQNLGRNVYGLEITPNYCAVILQRMRDAFPGIDIRRMEGGAA